MTGHQVPVLELPLNAEVHQEPHVVHGELIVPKIADVEVDGIGFADEDHMDVIIYWHSCPRYLGAQPDYCGCTLYSRTQFVMVIGGEGVAA